MIRRACVALTLHAASCVALVVSAAATVHLDARGSLLLVATALGAAGLVSRFAAGSLDHAGALAVAWAWFAVGLVHHVAVGIDPLWRDQPVSGVGHVGWDLLFHLPPLVLAVAASPRQLRRLRAPTIARRAR